MIAEFLIMATLSVLLAVGLARNAYGLGQKLGVLDYPDNDGGRKRHKRPTPLVGGLVSLTPALLLLILMSVTGDFVLYASLFVGILAFMGLGLLDDREHIRPVYRLATSAFIVVLVLMLQPEYGLSFLKFSFLNYAFFLDGWSVLLTILCIVGLLNAVNMADGSNGLVIGMSIIWSGLLLLYAPPALTPVLITTLCALFVAFAFNWKSHLFLGDSGSYGLSAYFGFMAIYTYNYTFSTLNAEAVALWFLVPVLDCVRLMVMRVISGNSPFHADRNHLHHYVQDAVSWPYGLGAYLAVIGGPSLIVYAYPELALMMIILTAIAYFLVLTGLMFFRNRNQQHLTL